MEQSVCPVFEPVWVQEIKIEPADLPDLKEEDPTAGYGDSPPNATLGDESEEACEDFQVKSEEQVKTEIEVEEHSIPEEDSSLLTSDSSDIRDQQDELESDQRTPVVTEDTICKMFTEKPFKLPFNMESIDTEIVIDEIRKRPALWDPSSDDYKNRQQKKDGWIEVCGIFVPDYTERSDEEKVQIGKDIQLKWRHIRDAYVRYIRLTKKGKSGNGAKPVKTYIYAKHLDFLKVTVSPNSTETSLQMQVLGDAREVNDATIGDDSPNTAGREFQSPRRSSSTVLKRRKRNLEEKLMSYIDMQQEEIKRGKSGEDNDDMTFFKSLMPTLQKLRPEEKLAFRVDVMKLLITYCESKPQNVPQHSQTYNIPYQQPTCGSNFPVSRPSVAIPQPSPHMMLSIQPSYPQVENSQTLPIHHLSIEPPHAQTSMCLPSATGVTSMQIQRQAASPESSLSPALSDSNTSFVSDSSESLLSCI